MNRRAVLGILFFGVTSFTAGCYQFEGPSGVNEMLEIDNDLDKEVTLTVLIDERQDDGEYDPITETDITVTANGSTERDLLGQSQYRITVSGIGQEVQFTTRPICDGARTQIIITESERLNYRVADCEGIVHTRDDE